MLATGWPGDQYVLAPPATTFLEACDRDPPALRVGVLTTPVIVEDAPVDVACLDAVRDTAALLADLGHEVDEAPVPFPAQRWASFEAIWSVLAAAIPVPPRPNTCWSPDALATGRGSSLDAGYAQAIATMQTTTRDTARAWAGYDVILSPTLASLPARVGEFRDDADPAADFVAQSAYTPWTSVWNLTGRPAMSLPLHRVELAGVTARGCHGRRPAR